ncbi:MAG: type II toxin-antitoxin system VapB family antitoxin [Steroidobacteraceae bacterium]
MAENLRIDPRLIEDALEVSDHLSASEVVTQALEEFIARRKQSTLLGLLGSLDWDPSYHYRLERSR